jgi:hypothetical protein
MSKNQKNQSSRKEMRKRITEETRFQFSMELRKKKTKGEGDAEEFPTRHCERTRRSVGRRFQRTEAI